MSEEKKGLISQFKEVFKGFNPDDQDSANLPLQSGAGGYTGVNSYIAKPENKKAESGAISSDWIEGERQQLNLLDRFSQYKHYQNMAEEPIFDGAIDMHLSHALSEDAKTGRIITIESTDKAFDNYATEINNQLGSMINENIVAWAKICAIFGAHYIRPYAESGKGIVHMESGWHTLAHHIREYERSGSLAGFTSEHLKRETSSSIELAPPWTLVGMKIPSWKPNIFKEPINLTGERYSLYDDAFHRSPVETQNYGTSLLHGAYEPWLDMRDGLKSLRGSRNNASRIDRLISVGMEGLTPHAAAEQLNLVGKQLKGNIEKAKKNNHQKGVASTIFTTLLPILSGGKNGITVDSQQTSPDIQHIEDIMFSLKRSCSGIGIDVSLLGWGDLMSGGLGDGGFFRNSIQAAQRANLLRKAARTSVYRFVDIHMVYKYGKTFAGKRPYEVKFHSLNTAIEQEKASAMLTKSEYASSVATVLDIMQSGSLSNSPTYKNMMMNEMLELGEEKTEAILSELKLGAKDQKDGFMVESVEALEQYIANAAKTQINNILMQD